MAKARGPQDAELRRVIEQQFIDLETAAEISRKAAQPDLPATDDDPFPVASSVTALQLIRDKMAGGQVTDSVVYFIARYSVHELENQLRQQKEQARGHGSKGGNKKHDKWATDLGFPSSDELKTATLAMWDRDYDGRVKKEVLDIEVAAAITRNGNGNAEMKASTVTAWRRERDKKRSLAP